MSHADLMAMLPLLILAGSALVVMLVAAFHSGHGAATGLTLIGLAATLASLGLVAPMTPHRVGVLLVIDAYALFYIAFIVSAAMVVTVFSHGYLAKFHLKPEEYYILLLLATLGACVLAASNHLATFFLGLELLSVALYVMIAYVFRREHAMEAAVKYLILAAASSAFLIFGMALVYAQLGNMSFAALTEGLVHGIARRDGTLLAGAAMIAVGFGFKLAWAPFHMWTPDVYQGAPAPVTAFVATVSKGAMVALLLRFFGPCVQDSNSGFFTALAIVAIASMTLGNLLALRQANLKRLLAYSSIAHLGYLLVAFLAGGEQARVAVTFYIVSYALATLGAFGLIAAQATARGEPESVRDFTGLFWRRPWQAAVLAILLLSLIGLPLTAGFWGKFLIVAAGAKAGLWTLVILLALNSTLGLYYYLRVLMTAFATPLASDDELPSVRPVDAALLGGLAVVTLAIGIYPAPLVEWIREWVMGGG